MKQGLKQPKKRLLYTGYRQWPLFIVAAVFEAKSCPRVQNRNF